MYKISEATLQTMLAALDAPMSDLEKLALCAVIFLKEMIGQELERVANKPPTPPTPKGE